MATKKKTATKMVLLRTQSAGVHFGELASRDGNEAVLKNARRIWRWFGANTLNELALRGLDVSKSRVSEAVAEATILGVIEVIPLSQAAIENLRGASWK